MKKIIITLFLTILFYSVTLQAREFNMHTLRISEKKLALNEFKKLCEKRKIFKQQLYQKIKHKRSKRIKKSNIFNINKEHIMNESEIGIHDFSSTTNHFVHPTPHNMIDIHTQTNFKTDMIHDTTSIDAEDITIHDNIENDTSDIHSYEIRNKSINPWARKK